MQFDTLLPAINEQHGLTLTLGERFARGEQGAFAVRDVTGASFVLKWSTDASAQERFHRVQRVTEFLRGRGYPVPRHRFHGAVNSVNYSLQEALPGRPLGIVTPTHLTRLFELNALQVGSSPLPVSDWPQSIIDSVVIGCTGYCELASLDGYSKATRELLIQSQSLVDPHKDIACPNDDIVHFDFNPTNILIEDGQISGVVDWDGATSGDRMFDVVTLLFYTRVDRDARRAIWQYMSAHSTRRAISVYVAHMIIRQVDWSIRHHNAETVEYWIATADNLLNELASSFQPLAAER